VDSPNKVPRLIQWSDTTPAAPAGDINVKYQIDDSTAGVRNISSYVDLSALGFGAGTNNYLTKWHVSGGFTTLVNSTIQDSGTAITITTGGGASVTTIDASGNILGSSAGIAIGKSSGTYLGYSAALISVVVGLSFIAEFTSAGIFVVNSGGQIGFLGTTWLTYQTTEIDFYVNAALMAKMTASGIFTTNTGEVIGLSSGTWLEYQTTEIDVYVNNVFVAKFDSSGSIRLQQSGQGITLSTTEGFAFTAASSIAGYVNGIHCFTLDTTNNPVNTNLWIYWNGALHQVAYDGTKLYLI
jgi:hypothetical protein